ncbi:MAG: hypothetical protein M0P13_01200 [Fibrobacteraceae bacterium]|nr:hypothetical protein [Fibrobacteraceae bacterium]
MADFSELAAYLEGQADLGTDKVFFDEPWSLVRKLSFASSSEQKVAPAVPFSSRPVAAAVSVPSTPQPSRTFVETATRIVIPKSAAAAIPSAYESAENLESFYSLVAKEKIYAKAAFAKGEGKEYSPKLMLVFYAPEENVAGKPYFNTEEGAMIERLFASLKIEAPEIFVTYFSKKPVSRAVAPLVATVLKKMLEKEVSLVNPGSLIFFGEKLLKQALSQNANLNEFGGTPLDFGGVRATALIEPKEMLRDHQLKVITWKTHIPRCGFFI